MSIFGSLLGRDSALNGLNRFDDEVRLARREIRQGRFQRSMALVTVFSAVVSGFEAYTQHQRGAFNQKIMWTPVLLTPPTMAAGAAAVVSERAARRLLPAVSLVSIIDGLVGFGYHLRGIRRMPGGFRLGQYNVVMGPPIFAPLLMCTVGTTGLIAGLLRRESAGLPAAPVQALSSLARELTPVVAKPDFQEGLQARIEHGQFQQVMALTSALFAVLAGGEAYFEHLRGSFNQRLMWTPIWVTPPMVLAAVGAACGRRLARSLLPLVSAVAFLDGLLGFALHLRGIKRMPGRFFNFDFNITMGPPLFAPLLFSSVGMLGFIAALLRRKESN